MKFTEEDIQMFITLLDGAESFRPLVNKALDVVKSYSPELATFFDGLFDYSVQRVTNTFNQYCNNGFSREEAMLLTLNSNVALNDALNKTNKRK